MKQRQAQMSMQISMGKERFWYYSIFVSTLYVLLPAVAILKHKPQVLPPLFPMGLAWLYQYDMFYGDMQVRARHEAERMISEEPERFFLPKNSGLMT